jgi:hypothetical protein
MEAAKWILTLNLEGGRSGDEQECRENDFDLPAWAKTWFLGVSN